jgi:hypothetical protein
VPDKFTRLIACNDRLRAASIVDSIPFYRFISLNVRSDDGDTYDAVFPVDHAIPELIERHALVEVWLSVLDALRRFSRLPQVQ